MPSKNTKQVIKPIYHLAAIALLMSIFIVLNITGKINQNTQAPHGAEATLNFILSTRSLYILLFAFLLLVALGANLKGQASWANKSRKVSFWILSFITGKLYTWGAFFLSWGVASHFVPYIQPLPNNILFGAMSIMLGWAVWLQARGFAIWVWRRA